MDKRYQVFVSSTYADLQEERRTVIQTLMEMDCIPAGMELFPAADEEQWQFIRRVIDDCDYYLLIIGGRYGSLTEEGISYTEKEYDYAVERGIKVIALIHADPESISVRKSESSRSAKEKLHRFRERVRTGRLVKFWKVPADLPGLVALSLSKTIKMYPSVGWIRGDTASNLELLEEINALRKRNEELQSKLAKSQVDEGSNLLGGITFEQIRESLAKREVKIPKEIAGDTGVSKVDLLSLMIMNADALALGISNAATASDAEKFLMQNVASPLLSYGLAQRAKVPSAVVWQRLALSKEGIAFLNWVRPIFERLNQDSRERTSTTVKSQSSRSRAIGPTSADSTSTSKVAAKKKTTPRKRSRKE
jgi:hypothetical protein